MAYPITRRTFLKAGLATGITGSVLSLPQLADGGPASAAATAPGLSPRFGDGRDWFFEKRFGMFTHWGIYSVAGWHEQHMYRKKLTRAQYAPFMRQFNPTKFDPDAWLDLAEQAGMQYLTFTTKHADGFRIWDTK